VEIDGTRSGAGDTATQILDAAERLIQVRGFNAFSYAHVAAELNITKPALHYHFPGKSELGEALIKRYSARFAAALATVESRFDDAPARLDAYADLYIDVLRKKRMCLCGMLAAEYQTLPEGMQDAVVRFFSDNESWVSGILEQGLDERTLHFEGPTGEVARMIVSGMEGAMLLAWPLGDVASFQAAAHRLLTGLKRVPSETVLTQDRR
jgi:TetR/AcrR family transcriptional regulator, transcriptional repressor for nem operon